MNSNNQHPMDDIIDRELQGLRKSVESKHGMGDAILAMQKAPVAKSRVSLKWPIGVGSVAVAVGAVVLVGSLTTGKAYAGELHAIASAQEHQKTMYQKAFIYGGSKTPTFVTELWLDHDKEAFRQFKSDGSLSVARVRDGKKQYHYTTGDSILGIKPYAELDEARGSAFQIESITSYLQSDFFQKHSIEKTSGVKLNGRVCDLYNFAKGYFRIWVDPVSKLPIQREVYNKGVTLWERDVYSYPESFQTSVFEPVKPAGLEYYDFIAARKEIQQKLDAPGMSVKVGDTTITLKAVVKSPVSVRAIWETTGANGFKNDGHASVEISGARNGVGSLFGSLTAISVPSGHEYLNEQLYLDSSKPFKVPATVRIAAWVADSSNSGKTKLAGWATFTVKDVIVSPSIEQLLHRATDEIGKASTAKDNR